MIVIIENIDKKEIHSKWNKAIDIDTGIVIGFRCENCYNRSDFPNKICPYCFAKMDL